MQKKKKLQDERLRINEYLLWRRDNSKIYIENHI